MEDNLLKLKMKFTFNNFQFPIKDIDLKRILIRILYYFRIWLTMSKNSFLMILNQKSVLFIFLAGKILRFIFFSVFLLFLIKDTGNIAGYNWIQMYFFFLTYLLIDTISQFLFREVYRFRTYVVTGDFDLILVKPANSLFRVLVGGADFIDLLTIPPLILGIIYSGNMLSPSLIEVLLYILLVSTGLFIATAFHIIVLALGIITMEVDHTIMIYRDVTNMGRFPADIYKEPLKSTLTFIIPVAIMMSLPARALMGLANITSVLTAVFFALMFLFLSIKFWDFALKKYSSASS